MTRTPTIPTTDFKNRQYVVSAIHKSRHLQVSIKA
jgi:hypothetical protein